MARRKRIEGVVNVDGDSERFDLRSEIFVAVHDVEAGLDLARTESTLVYIFDVAHGCEREGNVHPRLGFIARGAEVRREALGRQYAHKIVSSAESMLRSAVENIQHAGTLLGQAALLDPERLEIPRLVELGQLGKEALGVPRLPDSRGERLPENNLDMKTYRATTGVGCGTARRAHEQRERREPTPTA